MSAEAASGSGEIAKNISGVAEAAQNTTHGANDSLKASQALAKMSTELRELVAVSSSSLAVTRGSVTSYFTNLRTPRQKCGVRCKRLEAPCYQFGF